MKNESGSVEKLVIYHDNYAGQWRLVNGSQKLLSRIGTSPLEVIPLAQVEPIIQALTDLMNNIHLTGESEPLTVSFRKAFDALSNWERENGE